jgi:hypothetical protein
MFCIFFLVFHVLHMYLFETFFFWRFSLFLCSNVQFKILFKSVALLIFFVHLFFPIKFFDFLFKIPFTMHNI